MSVTHITSVVPFIDIDIVWLLGCLKLLKLGCCLSSLLFFFSSISSFFFDLKTFFFRLASVRNFLITSSFFPLITGKIK